MSNLITLPPNALTSRPSSVFDDTIGEEDNLDAGIGQSYGILGYRGKVWTLRYRGTTYTIQDPQTGRPAQAVHLVILASGATKSKSYYPPGEFDPNDTSGKRPICASVAGDVPDADVQQKQSDNCVVCPRNAFYTNPKTGRPTRDCTDYKRLAVVLMPAYVRPLLGEDLAEPIFLRVPPASLNGLTALADIAKKGGWDRSWTYLTEIEFAPKAWPEMIFKWAGRVPDEDAAFIKDLRTSPLTSRIVGGNLRSVPTSHPAQPLPPQGMPHPAPRDMSLNGGGVYQQPAPTPMATTTAAPQTLGFGFGGTAPLATRTIDAEVISTPPQPSPSPGTQTTVLLSTQRETSAISTPTAPEKSLSIFGFGGAKPAAPEQPSGTVMIPQTVQPASPPSPPSLQAAPQPTETVEPADEDLDALIANTLNKPKG